ncbi:MAG: amidohydrolase [Candidatus Eremiobacteraeota bacterium]|nr:amidohydrolase [Candidatus Eremiobacteraeota bacterium]
MTATIDVPNSVFEQAIATRRDVHRHPELGFSEHRTSAIVAERLRRLGIDVHEGIAKTGVVGVLRGSQPGRTIMLRADMDALPMPEENDHDYRSAVDGVAHACGHDGHVAILLGAAAVLSERRNDLAGTIAFFFQPAEEGGGGARLMIEEGALERFGVERAYGLHLTSYLPLGITAFRSGPMLASSDEIDVTVQGRGGHASLPHMSVDPILTASSVVVALQHVVSRQTDPVEPAVVSVCSLHAGTTYNVIPSEATLRGTIRTFNEAVRAEMPERIRRVIAGTCEANGATFSLDLKPGFPVTVNDAAQAAYARELIAKLLGEQRVITSPQVMGSEDFSYFAQAVPSCFYFVGSMSSERTAYPNHHGKFDIDEQALLTGIRTTVALALDAPLHAP